MKFSPKYLWGLIPLFAIIALLYYFSNIVTFVILAWVLSMVGAPFVKFFRRFLGKNLAAGLTIGIFVIFGMLILWMFIPTLLQQARNLSAIDYGLALTSLEEPFNDWERMLQERGLLDSSIPSDTIYNIENSEKNFKDKDLIEIDSIIQLTTGDSAKIALFINVVNHERSVVDEEIPTETYLSFFDHAQENILSFINPRKIQSILSGLLGFLGNTLIAIFSIIFISFFFLKEQGLFSNIISSLVPDEYVDQTEHAVEESSALLVRYFIGIAVQVIVVTSFVSLLLVVLGIKNALLIGFFAALMNVIPYLGPILGASFAAIITITSNINVSFYNELLPMLGKVVLVFGIMQMVDNFIIQPLIFGKSVKAHPLEIFIVILVGGQLGGVIGMVVAIPAYTVLRVLAKVFLSEFKVVQRITKSI